MQGMDQQGPGEDGGGDWQAAATAEVELLRQRVRRANREVAEARYRALVAAWQTERLRSNRTYALVRATGHAVRRPSQLPHLPGQLRQALSRRPVPPPPRPAILDLDMHVATATDAMARHDYEAALAETAQALATDPDHAPALQVRRTAQYKLGRITDSLDTLVQLREVADTPALRVAEAGLRGRIRETDPAWLPRIPGPAHPVDPVPGRVLHLLKESRPYRTNGFCMRSHYSLHAQQQAGLDPVVVTSLGFPRSAGVAQVPRVEDVDGIRHHRLDLGPTYPWPAPFDQQLRDQALLTAWVAARERPELIHAGSGHRGYEPALVGRALRDHLQVPLVYEVRSFFESTWTGEIERSETGQYYERRRATEDRCVQAADAVITIGESMRSEIIARGVPPERVFVVPNGVDPQVFHPRVRNPELAARYRLDARPVLGYVSNLDHPREGQEVLIDATAELARRGQEVTCLLVGDGGRREELVARAASAGVADRVVFTGAVAHEEVADVYALIDVFVVPRRDERAARLVTPLKPYEAMATGLPVIVSDLPALTEIAVPGERGLAFRAGDAVDLADVAARLLGDPDLAARLAENGRAWVLAERSWAANGPRYRAVYDEVLATWRDRQPVAS